MNKNKRNFENRKKRKSEDIYEAVSQLTTKYTELDREKLLQKFEDQSHKCKFCKSTLEPPKIIEDCSERYHLNYNQPSIDRIDNSIRSHSVDNVNITCWMCNIMRGETDIELWQIIIDLLLGHSSTLDLSKIEHIDSFCEKRFNSNKEGLPVKYIKEQISIDNIRSLTCPISRFPIFVGKARRHPFLPSFDRIRNNDCDGNKLPHSPDNLNMVCSFINFGRNCINELSDFIDIFNKKFPNRSTDIKVIYPDTYKWRVDGNQFITEGTYIERQKKQAEKKERVLKEHYLKKILQQYKNKILNSPFNKLKKNVKYPSKQLRAKWQKVVNQIIRDYRKYFAAKEWANKHGSGPGFKDVTREELKYYEWLSILKNKKIYEKWLINIPGVSSKPQSDINNELWHSQWLRVFNKELMTKDLSYWVSTQRKQFVSGQLSKERILQCEKIPEWWWTERHQGYNRNKGWFESNPNKLPNKTKHNTQYNWFVKIRKMYIDNKLSAFEISLCEKIDIFNSWLKYGKPIGKKDTGYNDLQKHKYNVKA